MLFFFTYFVSNKLKPIHKIVFFVMFMRLGIQFEVQKKGYETVQIVYLVL